MALLARAPIDQDPQEQPHIENIGQNTRHPCIERGIRKVQVFQSMIRQGDCLEKNVVDHLIDQDESNIGEQDGHDDVVPDPAIVVVCKGVSVDTYRRTFPLNAADTRKLSVNLGSTKVPSFLVPAMCILNNIGKVWELAAFDFRKFICLLICTCFPRYSPGLKFY
jgi:hypothetical protein